MLDDKLILNNGATPLTVADAIIRECADEQWLEDVVYFIQTYIDRTYKDKRAVRVDREDDE